MQTLRLPVAAVSGTAVTVMVFALLWHFVNVDFDVGAVVKPVKIEFTAKRVDSPVETKREPKIERVAPKTVPKGPSIRSDYRGTGEPVAYAHPAIAVAAFDGKRAAVAGIDRDPSPIVRVAPEYPPAAVARDIEGWVQVQFSIGPTGAVEDAVVVAAEPRGTFDAAALKAIARWRYSPKIEGGEAVKRVGLQTVIRFTLD
jgi:protein TonB